MEEIEPLATLDFFQLTCEIPYKKLKKLPDTSSLLDEESGTFSLAWFDEGLLFETIINKPLEETDTLELFIDTRDLKTSTVGRFCHHFLITPKPSIQEITRFRHEESRPFIDLEGCTVEIIPSAKKYTLKGTITGLFGFDPFDFESKEFPRLGFNYIINKQQHFSFSSGFDFLALHPSLWASLILKKS